MFLEALKQYDSVNRVQEEYEDSFGVESSVAESSTQRPIRASAFALRARIRERCNPVNEKRIVSEPEKNAESRNRTTSAAMEKTVIQP